MHHNSQNSTKEDLCIWERLTSEEYNLATKLFHQCNKEEINLRRQLQERGFLIDFRWGFYDGSWWGFIRRKFYLIFVHWYYRKQKL